MANHRVDKKDACIARRALLVAKQLENVVGVLAAIKTFRGIKRTFDAGKELFTKNCKASSRMTKNRRPGYSEDNSKFWSGVKYGKRANDCAQVMLSIH